MSCSVFKRDTTLKVTCSTVNETSKATAGLIQVEQDPRIDIYSARSFRLRLNTEEDDQTTVSDLVKSVDWTRVYSPSMPTAFSLGINVLFKCWCWPNGGSHPTRCAASFSIN